ncbi:pyrroline-5-carboxylate reductase 3 isoform X3 [Anguilla rostrata]|uniref:pyrroline-5-carboxylate reductase 3 isoform X3 n=1 Tax=Anguilla rostrata TaxID=7938 RepID=UPI0030D0521A
MRCIVPGCYNAPLKLALKAHFHSFPRDATLCQTWIDVIRHPNITAEEVRKRGLRVCSDHFEDTDYQGDRLKRGTVPTVFPWSVEPLEDHSLSPPTTSVANEPTSLLEHITKDSTGKIDTVTIKSEVLSDPGGKMNKVSTQCKTEQRCSADVPIGFVGAGNMAFGITQGILMSGEVSAENVRVSAPSSNNLGRFREMGVGITHSNTEVVSSSRLVFLAVKPHLVPGVLQEIASHVTREHIVVSVAAGVTVATVEALLPPDSVVLRLMPNLPCLVQEGALLFARGSKARPEHGALLRDLLAPCGLVEEGPESWIDAHTGLSGSGVAFVYLFAEALAEGGVKMGMPSALAHRIAAQTVLGAGRLLRDSGKHPAQLRADVCTPGGTTIFGLHELERGGVRAATMGAVEAATERARELGRK